MLVILQCNFSMDFTFTGHVSLKLQIITFLLPVLQNINFSFKAQLTHLKCLPPVSQIPDLALYLVSGKVAIFDHVRALLTHVIDPGLVPGQLGLEGLVFLHQVLHTDQITT